MPFPLESLGELILALIALFTSVAMATVLSQGFDRETLPGREDRD